MNTTFRNINNAHVNVWVVLGSVCSVLNDILLVVMQRSTSVMLCSRACVRIAIIYTNTMMIRWETTFFQREMNADGTIIIIIRIIIMIIAIVMRIAILILIIQERIIIWL